jgi:type IV pilus assembly protein PilM
MGLIPTTVGTRPRLAVEIRLEGVVAARSEDSEAQLSAVAQGPLGAPAAAPVLKGDAIAMPPDAARRETIAAVKKALDAVALKERQTTLVLPDAAVRVLLLDFDQLPPKTAEALSVVRFRLKKLLPFDADNAVISYQVMSQSRGLIRVLAVAIPQEVLADYESLVREAGFEPGAVLPSTLAACAGLPEMEAATLVVNAGEHSVTTAIVQNGVLLLHRTVDLALDEATAAEMDSLSPLPLVDVESSAGEWAMQAPLNGYGVLDDEHISAEAAERAQQLADEIAAELAVGFTADATSGSDSRMPREAMLPAMPVTPQGWEARRHAAAAREISQALSVAAAYFEDTLQSSPETILAAGTIGAETLAALLREAGFAEGSMRVLEMVQPAMLTGGATTTRVPRGWMAGVRGALRS